MQNNSESIAQAALRTIPDELDSLGQMLKRAGFSASKINQVLESEAHQRSLVITWTYQDIYNKFSPSIEEKALDANNFIEFLQQRYRERNLYFNTSTDSGGCLNQVFWVLEQGVEIWSECLEHNPTLYDTTHGTNRYSLKFGAFTTVGKDGNTCIIAGSLISSETVEAFEWVFNEFVTAFRLPPKVLFTDGDAAMSAAIKNILPETTHLLCTYHLSKNLLTHVKPIFTGIKCGSKEKWIIFCREWWKICKKQDALSDTQFETEWDMLINLAEESRVSGSNNSVLNCSLRWLQNLKERKNSGLLDTRGDISHLVYTQHKDQNQYILL